MTRDILILNPFLSEVKTMRHFSSPITPELAKQLAEAGFPWIDSAFIYSRTTDCPEWEYNVHWHRLQDGASFMGVAEGYESVGVPSLSQLIEACGDRFAGLNVVYKNDRIDYDLPKGWHAYTKDGEISIEGENTPEEAVAKLWLELNK